MSMESFWLEPHTPLEICLHALEVASGKAPKPVKESHKFNPRWEDLD